MAEKQGLARISNFINPFYKNPVLHFIRCAIIDGLNFQADFEEIVRMDDVEIRPAREEDVPVINEIYNHAVRTSTYTFDTEDNTYEERLEWLRQHNEQYPVFVAVIDGKVVGWGSLSRYGPDRPGWRFTCESSIYVAPDCKGLGLGKLLTEYTVKKAKELGYRAIIAQVVEGNIASLKMLERHGYEKAGVLKDVGYKHGQWLDVILMEKLLPLDNENLEAGNRG